MTTPTESYDVNEILLNATAMLLYYMHDFELSSILQC